MMVSSLSVAFAVIFHVSVDSSDDDVGSEAHRVTGGDGARGRVAGDQVNTEKHLDRLKQSI
jgi:hypothetical protein